MASEHASVNEIERLLADGFEVLEVDSNDHAVVVDLAKGPIAKRVEIGRDEVARFLGLRPRHHLAGIAVLA